MDNCQTGGLAARIDLEPQQVWLGSRHSAFEDDRERVAAGDGRLSFREQPTRAPDASGPTDAALYPQQRRATSLVLSDAPLERVTVFLAKVRERFLVGGAGCYPVCLFNHRPQRFGLERHPKAPIHSLLT
jgi:hypothetical protein